MSGWGRGLLLLALSLATSSGFANTAVVMNKAFAELQPENDYNYQLLKRALTITATEDETVVLEQFPLPMTQTRLIHELTSGKKVQVGVLASGYWKRPGIIAIPVPVRRGLLGWRLLVTRSQTLDKLPDLAADTGRLSSLTTGFGADWVELPLMQQTFAHVDTVKTTAELYQQLLDGNFDVFSRSVIELWLELDSLGDRADELAVVPGVVLRYPFADFFYVSGEQPELAAVLSWGYKNCWTMVNTTRCSSLSTVRLLPKQGSVIAALLN